MFIALIIKLLCLRALNNVSVDCLPPTDDESYASRKEAGTKAAIEPGYEGVWNLGDTL